MSPAVSDWPARLALTLAMVGVIALVCWGMWRGWRRRGELQSGLSAPHQFTGVLESEQAVAACEGRYIATVRDGDWLDRIVVHGLGTPSRCRISVLNGGVVIARDGADGFFIPRSDLVRVSSGKGIAGEVLESGGVGIIAWRLGDTVLATGFRADSAAAQQSVLNASAELISSATAGGQ